MAMLGVPGLSVAVFDEGEIIWAKGYGVRDKAVGAAVTPTTRFQAASISKPVTSAALFRLVEQGVLGLDEDVNDRLRRWKVPQSPLTESEKVTPRRIITHIAGLGVHGYLGYAPGEPLPTILQILDGLAPANSKAVRVEVAPGAKEIYSGGGFIVLQLLMEDVTGRPFPELMQALVLDPVGMAHSRFAQPLPAKLAANAATGYEAKGAGEVSPVAGRYSTYPELAAAGLWSTPSDLARFMLAIGRSYRGEPGRLLSPTSGRTMLTKLPPGGGQGFGLSGEGEAFRYRHNGGNAGFTCYAVAFVGSGRGVVMMTNSDAGDGVMHELGRAISRVYNWPPLWRRE